MGVDRIFQNQNGRLGDFAFNEETVSVFDDMLERSVPFYDEIQRMLVELASDFAVDGTSVYDIGCSTGTTLRNLDSLPQNVQLVGVDSSAAMIARAEENLANCLRHPHSLIQRDLHQGVRIENASVVVMSLTLQFIRPLHREPLVKEIYDGLIHNGSLLLIEKVVGEESLVNRLYIQHYYDFKKRNGYSELEIARKREALENVLIPYRLQENEQLLRGAGFRAVDVFFKWYNFSGIVALK